MYFFIHFIYWWKKLEKRFIFGPLGWKKDFNNYITYFFFENIV